MTGLMRFLIVSAALLIINGCATPNLMQETPGGQIASPGSDKAVIVFMRSSFVAGAIGAELFEINDGELTLVGQVPNGSKLVHLTDPGEKVFMAYGTAADFMLAQVEKGKTYYAILRPNWGSGAFIPTPVKRDGSTSYNTESDEFAGWLGDTRLLEKKADSDEWFKKNKAKYEKIYQRYWEKFQTKSDEQKQVRTLMPSDGL